MAKQTETKPGVRTTEFWLSAAATVLGALLIGGVFDDVDESSWINKALGTAIALLASLGYTVSRTKAKNGGPE